LQVSPWNKTFKTVQGFVFIHKTSKKNFFIFHFWAPNLRGPGAGATWLIRHWALCVNDLPRSLAITDPDFKATRPPNAPSNSTREAIRPASNTKIPSHDNSLVQEHHVKFWHKRENLIKLFVSNMAYLRNVILSNILKAQEKLPGA